MSIKTSSALYGAVYYSDDLYSSEKSLTAQAASGYSFIYWKDGNERLYTNPLVLQYTGIATHKTITAVFKQNTSYVLYTDYSSIQNGSVTIVDVDSSTYNKRATAIPDEGYVFSHWTGDCITEANKNSNPLVIDMRAGPSSAKIQPVFAADTASTILHYYEGTHRVFNIIGELTQESIGYATVGSTVARGDQNQVVCADIGTTVTSIAQNAFADFTGMSSITIRSQLASIGEMAFYRCSALSSIDFSKIKALNKKSFYGSGLTCVSGLNQSIHSLPEACFMACSQLSSVSIPSTVTSIGSNCFSNCGNLLSIDCTSFTSHLPSICVDSFDPVRDTVSRSIHLHSKEMSRQAYADQTWLNFIYDILPTWSTQTVLRYNVRRKDIVNIDLYLYNGQSRLSIDYGDSSASGTDAGLSVFSTANGKYSISHKYTSSLDAIVRICGNISAISWEKDNNRLTAIEQLADSIVHLPSKAAKGIASATVVFPSSIESIDAPLIQLKTTSNQFPAFSVEGSTNVPQSPMWVTQTQGQVSLPYNWIVLDSGKLANLYYLATFTRFDASSINSLTCLTARCFGYCSRLESISLPSTIEEAVLPLVTQSGLPALTQLTIQSGGKFTVQNGMLISYDGKICLTTHSPGSSVPTNVKSIGKHAFANTACTSLVFPTSMTSIDSYAFTCNDQLTSVTIPGIYIDDAKSKIINQAWMTGPKSAYGESSYEVDGTDDMIKTAGDAKQTTSQVHITCKDGQAFDYIAVTDEIGYILASLRPAKVKCLTVSNDYSNLEGNQLPGMTNDSDRFSALLNGFATIEVLKNASATRSNVISKITSIISSLGEDGLFIFHISGHGAQSNGAQYMCLYNLATFWDYEFWELISNARCRVMAIFCTCHSGTMYAAPSLDSISTSALQSTVHSSSISWASSAEDFFADPEQYVVKHRAAMSKQNALLAASGNTAVDADGSAVDYRHKIRFSATERASLRLCVYSACGDDEVSWMVDNVGHNLMTSLIENFEKYPYSSYSSLFNNATTENETSRQHDGNKNYGDVNPEMTTIGSFDTNIRAFT